MNAPYPQPPYAPHPPPKSSNFVLILVIVAVLIVPVFGVVATLGVYGVRKYVANAKTAEARNVLGQLGKDAVAAYESSAGGKRRICPSATKPVPANESAVSGKKYQSTPAEWDADKAANAGFACLKFEMSAPQYFQYSYESTGTGFVARARGDLNGDGAFSSFELHGQIVGDKLVVAPSLMETNPED